MLGGQYSTMVSMPASGPSSPGFKFQPSQKNFRGKKNYFAEVNQQRCLEESCQWIEIVEQAHRELARARYFNKRYAASGCIKYWKTVAERPSLT